MLNMGFLEFIKERSIFLFINIIILCFTSVLLMSLEVYRYAILFIFIINFIGIVSFHIWDYFRRKKYYEEIIENINSLDKKYLISEMIDDGGFLDGKILYDIIKISNKSMADEISSFKRSNKEFREYIELWVHEVKTPLASSRLLIENNESQVTKSIEEDLKRVEDYIEQALFYARSNDLEKDYIIKKINIKSIVSYVINLNADILIKNKVRIKLDNLDNNVYSDNKWVEFIVGQIISNSLKYMDKEQKELSISCENNSDKAIILKIKDNGVGIPLKDISKVFDKGFTGENGRKFGKSTGIGLYLCKKLCTKLGLEIGVESKEKESTEVCIVFPVSEITIFE